jgi:hypothetical protein
MTEDISSSLKPRLQGYMVSFVDVMGQSDKLKKLRDYEWWKLDDQTQTLLSETYGRVKRFRELYSRFLDNLLKPSKISESFLATNPKEEEIKYWEATRITDLQINYIADSIIAMVPMQAKFGVLPFSSILALMGACCFAILSSFCEHRSIRGGVALGPCVFDPNTNEVYGTSLSIAVELEKKANWPRILVDHELIRVAKVFVDQEGNNIDERLNTTFAKRCLSLVADDIDGKPILDYLGPGIRGLYDIQDKIAQKAFSFVQSQTSKYTKDQNLFYKYDQVKKYFESHGIE